MVMMPLGLMMGWVGLLLSVGVVGGGAYLIWGWTQGVLIGTGYLVAGIGMVAWTLLGRVFILMLRPAIADEPAAVRSQDDERIQRPDGTELHVERYGQSGSPLLVLTHGWGTDSAEYYYAKELLAQDFELLFWDLPGLGKSRAPKNGDFSLEKLADDLKAVLDLEPQRPAVLLGHSMGGMITQKFCELYPQYLEERVKGLVLLHTTHTNPVRTSALSGLATALQRPVLEPLCWLSIALSPLVWAANVMSYLNGTAHIGSWLTGFAGSQSRGQWDFATRYTALCSPAVVARGMLAMFRFDATHALPSISVPALVICGAQDPTTRPEASERIAALMPEAELVKLTPGSHMAHMERYPEFVRVVREFSARALEADLSSLAFEGPAASVLNGKSRAPFRERGPV